MAIADRNGFPLSISIADGSRHDVALTDQTLDEAIVDERPPILVGDKAWDSQKHQKQLANERASELVAPVRSTSRRKQDGTDGEKGGDVATFGRRPQAPDGKKSR